MSDRLRRLVFCALLTAAGLVLSFLEQQIPVLPWMPPGVKLGLSNVCVMFSMIFLGLPYALFCGLLKALFVFGTRGLIAGLLSAAGALASILGMWLLRKLRASYLLMSVGGGVLHNLGQLAVVSLWLKLSFFSYYLPLLVTAGTAAGLLTGAVLRAVMPALARIAPKEVKR